MTTEELRNVAIAKGETFIWHELDVKDAEAAVEFYTKAFGFGTQSMDMGPMGMPGQKYHMLTKDGQTICGIMGTGSMPGMEQVPHHWAVFLAVDDVDARLATCQQLGATVVAGPMDVPEVGRMVLIQDNKGAHIWLFKPSL